MSKYGWTLWASIQDGNSDLDFDFWEWGMEKYERAVEEFDSAAFDTCSPPRPHLIDQPIHTHRPAHRNPHPQLDLSIRRNRWPQTQMSDDERRLAELGYKQDLSRNWSGFSNFAISFSIISILAGCFTNFGAGWNNGGPISISWSWPILERVHPDHRLHDVRARVGLPDLGRHLLVGLEAGRRRRPASSPAGST